MASEWCSHNELLDQLCRKSYQLHTELAQKLNGAENYEYRTLDTYSVNLDLSNLSSTLKENKLPQNSQVKESKRSWLNGPAIDTEDNNQFQVIGNEENTAQVHPELFCKTLLNYAQKTGRVFLREETSVENLIVNEEEKKIIGVKLSNGEDIENIDDVIFCMGPWSYKIANWISKYDSNLAEKLQNFIIPEKYYSVVIEPYQNQTPISSTALFLKNSSPATKLSEPEIYPRSSGKVYICGCEEVVPLPDDPRDILPNAESYCKVCYCHLLIYLKLINTLEFSLYSCKYF